MQSIYPQVLCSYSSVAFPVSFVSLKHWQCSLHCTSLVLPHKPFSFVENKYTVLTEILPFITQINLYTAYLMLEADPKISREFEDCFGKSCLPYWLPFHFRALVLTAFQKGFFRKGKGIRGCRGLGVSAAVSCCLSGSTAHPFPISCWPTLLLSLVSSSTPSCYQLGYRSPPWSCSSFQGKDNNQTFNNLTL